MFLCRTDNHLIFPWKILSIGALGRTVQQFFFEVMLTSLKSNETGVEMLEQLELSVAFLEKSKDSLDAVELSVSLDMAVQFFGCFLRYHVDSSREASSHSSAKKTKRRKTLPLFVQPETHRYNASVLGV